MSVYDFDKKLDDSLEDYYGEPKAIFFEISEENLAKANQENNCPDEYLTQTLICDDPGDYNKLNETFSKELGDSYKNMVEEHLKKIEDEYNDMDEWDEEYWLQCGVIICNNQIVFKYILTYKNYIDSESGEFTQKNCF